MYYVENENGDYYVRSEHDADDCYGPFAQEWEAKNQCEFLNHWDEEEW